MLSKVARSGLPIPTQPSPNTWPVHTAELPTHAQTAGSPRALGSTTLAGLSLEIDLTLAAWRNPGERFFGESTKILDAWNRKEVERAATPGTNAAFILSLTMQQRGIDAERERALAALEDDHNKGWGEEYLRNLDDRQTALDQHAARLVGAPYEPTHYTTQTAPVPRPSSRRKAAKLGFLPPNLSCQLGDPLAQEVGYQNLRHLINEKRFALTVADHVNTYLQEHPEITSKQEIDEVILAFGTALQEQEQDNNLALFENAGVDMHMDPTWRPKPAKWLRKVGLLEYEPQVSRARRIMRAIVDAPLKIINQVQTRFGESRKGLKTAAAAGAAIALGTSALAFIDSVGDYLNGVSVQAAQILKQHLMP